MRLAISVIAMTAAKARTGDGPWYGSSVRRVPSIAWEPVALSSPTASRISPARNSHGAAGAPPASTDTRMTARPRTDPIQPMR